MLNNTDFICDELVGDESTGGLESLEFQLGDYFPNSDINTLK